MDAEILFTLKDGTQWRDTKKMIKHLDQQVSNTSREISELLSHKNATEIQIEIAHRVEILFHKFVSQSNYLDHVMMDVKKYSLTVEGDDF